MLHDFGGDLLDFDLQRLRIYPYRDWTNALYETVETCAPSRRGANSRDLLAASDAGGWRIYDVAISGISLLVSFREAFGEKREQQGLDELIAKLKRS